MSGPSVREIKERLQRATYVDDRAYPVRIDSAWFKGGVERMYFDHPISTRVMGSVEIDTTVERVEQVRIELLVPPSLAEMVVELVQSARVEEDPVIEVVKADPVIVVIPPTRDPGPADLEEMELEEKEGDGLPAEVLSVMPEESL